jgi:hypothetical protein
MTDGPSTHYTWRRIENMTIRKIASTSQQS